MQDPGAAGEIKHGAWTICYLNNELAAYQRDQFGLRAVQLDEGRRIVTDFQILES